MAKRGRPAKTDTLTLAQLALNQVDAMARFNKIDMALTSLVKGVDDFVTTANKVNQELAKRIQAVEVRCADLEHKIVSKEESSDLLEDVEKETEC